MTTDNKAVDIEKVFNEFLLSILTPDNGKLVCELRTRWKMFLNQPVLNNDTEDKDSITVKKDYWKRVHDDLRFLEATLDANADKVYTQSEVDAIREETWQQCRCFVDGCAPFESVMPFFKYKTINDYLNSLNPDNKPYTGKDSKEWEIHSVLADDKKPVYYPSNEVVDAVLKNNDGRIHSVKRLSDNTVFSVGDEVEWGSLSALPIDSLAETKSGVIEKFGFSVDGDLWAFGNNGKPTSFGLSIKILSKKQPQPTNEKTVTDNSDVACLSITDIKEVMPKYTYELFKKDFENKLNQKLKTHTP